MVVVFESCIFPVRFVVNEGSGLPCELIADRFRS